MDIRLDRIHTKLLRELRRQEGERTDTGMVRLLIRQAAKERGLWPTQAADPSTDVAELEVETWQA